MPPDTDTNFFDKFYKISDDKKSDLKKPLIRSKMVRMFDGEISAKEETLIDLRGKLDDLRMNITGYSLAAVCSVLDEMEAVEARLTQIKEEKTRMLG